MLGYLPNEEIDIQPLSLFAVALLAIPTLTVTIRRLHDRNWSGWWVLLGLIPLVLINSFDYFVVEIYEAGYFDLVSEYGRAPLALVVALLVMCGFKGNKGPNKYGDD